MAAPIDPNVLDRILEGADVKPIDASEVFSEPLVKNARKALDQTHTDEELLLTLFFSKPTLGKFYQNKRPIDTAATKTPVVALLQEMLKRRDIRTVSVQKGPLKLRQAF